MCKFVNTLSGKNAQSSALGASATARFFPPLLSPPLKGELEGVLSFESHCKDTSFPPLLLRIVRNHAPYMALRQPKPFPCLGVCPHKRHSLPYQSVIHLANRLVALLYLVSISVHNSKVRWI